MVVISLLLLLRVQWEKKCTARKDEASEGSRRTVIGPSSDDIHSGNVDSFEKNVYSNSLKSYPSNAVLPLQSYTNEYQVSCSGLSGVATGATSSEVCSGANNFSLQDFAGMLILSIENFMFYSLQLLCIYFLCAHFCVSFLCLSWT